MNKRQLVDASQYKYPCQISLSPLNIVRTWSIDYVNGYKFHTEDKSQGMKTFNRGICVIGTGEGGIVDDYYGILKDVIELVYPQEPTKKFVLFSCDWFNPTINHGIRVHREFDIIDIRCT